MSLHLLHIVTLLAVSLHAMLGCCWHHSHHCPTVAEGPRSEEMCPFHGHHHDRVAELDRHGHDPDRHIPHQHDPHQHDESCCDGVACTFYAPERPDSDLVSVCLTSAFIFGTQGNRLTSNDDVFRWFVYGHTNGVPNSRLHPAQLQVWLV